MVLTLVQHCMHIHRYWYAMSLVSVACYSPFAVADEPTELKCNTEKDRVKLNFCTAGENIYFMQCVVCMRDELFIIVR